MTLVIGSRFNADFLGANTKDGVQQVDAYFKTDEKIPYHNRRRADTQIVSALTQLLHLAAIEEVVTREAPKHGLRFDPNVYKDILSAVGLGDHDQIRRNIEMFRGLRAA